MSMDAKLEAIEEADAKEILVKFLKAYTSPAFGALPKREIDLIVYEMLQDVEALETEPSMYELMRDLKITRTKARTLVYDSKIRKHSGNSADLNERIKTLFSKAKFSKDGHYFVMEIEDPLLHADLKERVRKLGFVSDTSFNSALIKMPFEAVGEVSQELLTENEKEAVRRALIAAGAPDTSFKGVVKGALGKLATKAVGKAGDDLVEELGGQLSSFLGPIFTGAAGAVGEHWNGLWEDAEAE